MRVVKRNGSVESFNINKLTKSILAALHAGEGESSELERIVVDVVECCGESVDASILGDKVEEYLMSYGYYDAAKAYILYRNENREYDLWPKKGILANYIHKAKYARGDEDWNGTVERLIDMHEQKYPGFKDMHTIEELIKEKRLLPSMRSLQFGGEALMRQNERMYNCCFTRIDRITVFGEILYWLLCGSGVGYSVQQHHIDQLPPVNRMSGVRHYVIGDTIEGWRDAVYVLMYEYFQGGKYPEFSYHLIRDRGMRLKVTGGLAPGHEGLRDGIEAARRILIKATGRKLRAIECYDILCHLVGCVLSGGVRRSATLCLFDDTEMLYAKTGSWMQENPQRAFSNNSMIIHRKDNHLVEKIVKIIELSKGYGEPGFMFTDSLEWGINPCGEICLNPFPGGMSVCNLVECHSNDFYWAGVLGAMQSGYDNVSCKDWIWENRIMGCSITGVDWSNEDLEKGREAVIAGHNDFCRMQGWPVNPKELRYTCVKPSGTSALLLDGIESGIHPHPAKKYLRRVIGDCDAAKRFAEANPGLVEYDGERLYLVFPIRTDKNIDVDLLQEILRIKKHWIGPNGLNNNISATIITDDPLKIILDNVDNITALSFAPKDVDKKYPFAPQEKVDLKNQSFYDLLCKDLVEPDYAGIDTFGDKGGACEGEKCKLF